MSSLKIGLRELLCGLSGEGPPKKRLYHLPAYTPARTKHAKQQDERPTNLARRSRGTPFDMIHMGSIVNISAQAAIPFDGIDPL